jgi:two-component system, OmpR family, copper resistance phosphate regulon response regulator CusR
MRILLIEDNRDTAQTVQDGLRGAYVVEVSREGIEGENLIRANEYDLVIIDINLPDKNGVEVCKTIRKEGFTHPILMLTGEYGVKKKVHALDMGADDYVTKPFELEELKARIRSLLRRNTLAHKANILKIDGLVFDLDSRSVIRDGKRIHLTRKEAAILEYLMRNKGRVVSREMILSHIWRSTDELLFNTIDVHIKFLRDKVDRNFNKCLLKTMYGVGYKMDS